MTGRLRLIVRVANDPALRRIEIAFAGSALAEFATWLALLVYAFERGGVRETGVVATALLISAVIASPFAAFAGDRFRPGRALSAGYAAQALTATVVAVAMWRDAPVVAYGAAVGLTIAVSFGRPVVNSVLPAVTREPGDLVAANVVVNLIADSGLFLGPLTAAGLMAIGGPELVLGVYSIVLVLATLATIGLDGTLTRPPSEPMALRTLRRELFAGLRTLMDEPAVRALVVLLFVGALASGVMDVLVVSFADLRLVGGGSRAGILAAGFGLGAVIGSLSASALMGGARSGAFLVVGAATISVPFALLASTDQLATAVVLIGLIGAGQSMLLVSGSVAIQRRTPGDTLTRVFGAVESATLLAMAVGAAGGALLLDRLVLRDALWVIAAVLALTLGMSVAWLIHVGADAAPPPGDIMRRLAEDRIFTLVDLPTLERLAHGATLTEHCSGDAVITEGEIGDCYHLLMEGDVEVTKAGDVMQRLGPGTAFGEIALLRDVPRTASVTCLTDVTLVSIRREDFLEIVTGHPRRLEVATDLADGWDARTS